MLKYSSTSSQSFIGLLDMIGYRYGFIGYKIKSIRTFYRCLSTESLLDLAICMNMLCRPLSLNSFVLILNTFQESDVMRHITAYMTFLSVFIQTGYPTFSSAIYMLSKTVYNCGRRPDLYLPIHTPHPPGTVISYLPNSWKGDLLEWRDKVKLTPSFSV